MNLEQTLLKEVEDSKMWYDIEKEDTTYKRSCEKN